MEKKRIWPLKLRLPVKYDCNPITYLSTDEVTKGTFFQAVLRAVKEDYLNEK